MPELKRIACVGHPIIWDYWIRNLREPKAVINRSQRIVTIEDKKYFFVEDDVMIQGMLFDDIYFLSSEDEKIVKLVDAVRIRILQNKR